MTILVGGAFAAGAFKNNMRSETYSVPSTELSQWAQLRPDPLGRPYNVLRTRIAQKDYADYGNSKYRSELSGDYTKLVWGATNLYYWRMIIPNDWYSLGTGSTYIIGQEHDYNGTSVARKPTLSIDIYESSLRVVLNLDNVPDYILYSTPAIAGTEYEISTRIRYADGVNLAASQGILEVYHGDRLVAQYSGVQNTWTPAGVGAEPNPPYIKCGTYQAGYNFPWWQGKSATMYYVACAVGTEDETVQSMRAKIDAQLATLSNVAINL